MNEVQQAASKAAHVRWLIYRDMIAVLDIEHKSFEFPWCWDDFRRCFSQKNCIARVAEIDERIVGYVIYELHKTRLHILNLCVHPDYRRSGIGSQLVAALVSRLTPHTRSRIETEVRETNVAAQLFLRSRDFRAVSVLRNHYDDTPEDAYVMQYRLDGWSAESGSF